MFDFDKGHTVGLPLEMFSLIYWSTISSISLNLTDYLAVIIKLKGFRVYN